MGDNYTNKKSVDQAWSVMKDILDKEMPVKEEKRRFLFIPLLLGVGLFLGVGYAVYLWYPSNTSVPQSKEDSVTHEVSKEIAIFNAAEYKTKNNKSADITSVKQEKELPTKLSTIDNAYQKIGSTKPSLANSKQNIDAENKLPNLDAKISEGKVSENKNDEVLVIAAQSQLDLSTGSLQMLEDDSNKKRNEFKIQNETKQTSDRPKFIPSPVLAMVPSFAKFSILEVGINTKVRSSSYPKEFRKLKLDWSINLYGAQRLIKNNIAFNSGRSKSGYLGGIEILFAKWINKNWRLGSGLGYKLSGTTFGSWTNSSRVNLSSSFEAGSFLDLGSGGELSLSETTFFRGPQTHFISIPVFVERSLSSKWAVEAGLRYNQKIGNFRSVVFNEIRKSNVDFFLTPSFKLSNRWSLGLMLQHSTNQFDVKNTTITNENGRYQLGLVSRIRI